MDSSHSRFGIIRCINDSGRSSLSGDWKNVWGGTESVNIETYEWISDRTGTARQWMVVWDPRPCLDDTALGETIFGEEDET